MSLGVCFDTNECETQSVCNGTWHVCTNTLGSYECGCKDGWSLTDFTAENSTETETTNGTDFIPGQSNGTDFIPGDNTNLETDSTVTNNGADFGPEESVSEQVENEQAIDAILEELASRRRRRQVRVLYEIFNILLKLKISTRFTVCIKLK